MKKQLCSFILLIVLVPVLFSCTKSKDDYDFYDITYKTVYNPEDVKDAVIAVNGVYTDGEEHFFEFYEKCQRGEAASVRLASFYDVILGEGRDSERSAEDNEVSGYRTLDIRELVFDGEEYAVDTFSPSCAESVKKKFKYLKPLYFIPEKDGLNGKRALYYVLLNDNTIADYNRIMLGLVSSAMGDYVDHVTVFSQKYE